MGRSILASVSGPISSTDLSRNLSEILSRVQHRRESFTVVRNGKKIATLSPADSVAHILQPPGSWRAFAASIRHLPLEPSFADDLAEIQQGQAPAELPDSPSA